ncbi:hypothetical protein HK405_006147 [Cladochytrium tenue]|nr:hypothetical protein HK405_006147 [Cladochytrium tenue]
MPVPPASITDATLNRSAFPTSSSSPRPQTPAAAQPASGEAASSSAAPTAAHAAATTAVAPPEQQQLQPMPLLWKLLTTNNGGTSGSLYWRHRFPPFQTPDVKQATIRSGTPSPRLLLVVRLLWHQILAFTDLQAGLALADAHPDVVPRREVRWLFSKRDFTARVAHSLASGDYFCAALPEGLAPHLRRACCAADAWLCAADDVAAPEHAAVRSALPDELVFEMMRDTKYAILLDRIERYPAHPLHGDVRATARVVASYELFCRQLGNQDRKEREIRLLGALKRAGLAMRNDSLFCRAYVGGQTLADVDEVAATMLVTARLFEFGYPAWSTNKTMFESMVVDAVLSDGKPWIDAAVSVTRSNFFESTNMEVYHFS